MAEKTTFKLVPYQVDYICDDCGEGNMLPTGNIVAGAVSQNVRIEHKCSNPNCGIIREFSNVKYPRIEYRQERIE